MSKETKPIECAVSSDEGNESKKTTVTAVDNLNLSQKLSKIRNKVEIIKKDKKGFNYTYSDILEILAKITAGMKQYHVSLRPAMKPGTASYTPIVNNKVKFDKAGRQYNESKTSILFSSDMVFTWVNDDNPDEFIEIPWAVMGMQEDPSQAFGSGLTYCTRYFLTNYFQIAQDNDVDKYRTLQKEAEKTSKKEDARETMEVFDTLIRTYLAEHPDKKSEVKEFTCKYVKDSNYMSVKDPILATQMVKSFKADFLETEE